MHINIDVRIHVYIQMKKKKWLDAYIEFMGT